VFGQMGKLGGGAGGDADKFGLPRALALLILAYIAKLTFRWPPPSPPCGEGEWGGGDALVGALLAAPHACQFTDPCRIN
jgi:hypothetical protein